MTAKSRRRKYDKRRKSDEHPQPRRREEADRREACMRAHPAGKGLKGESVTIEFQEVSPELASLLCGEEYLVPGTLITRGLGDHGEWTPELQHEEDQVRREVEEALRTPGASDSEASSEQPGFGSPEEVIGAILDAKKRWEQPGSAQGAPDWRHFPG